MTRVNNAFFNAVPSLNPSYRYFFQLRFLTFLLALLVGTAGCATHEVKQSESATTGTLEVVADEQLKPVVDSLIVGFMSENPNAKLTARYETSAQAIDDFLSQKARVILVSRGLPQDAIDSMQKHSLTPPDFDVAEDALAVVVSSKNPVGSISMSDLRALLKNEVTDWSKLKRAAPIDPSHPILSGPIHLVLGPWRSSSSDWLLDSLFLPSDTDLKKEKAVRFQTSDSVLAALRKDRGVIGVVGASWWHTLQVSNDSTIRALSIIPADSSSKGITEPVMLHLAYIYEGIYPLTMRVHGYTFETPNTLPRGFMAYVTTAHGQTVFKNFGVLPRTQHIKIVPSK